MKFKSNIEVQAGLKDSSGSIGTSGQVLSSTGSNVSWINQSAIASDVQNQVKAGVAINKGQAVYVTGADGTNIIVGLASNTSEATSSKTLGLLNATVAINGFADVVQIGRLSGLNTIGANAGDPVWLGTNGNLIYGLINKPYAPAHLVFLGIVTRVNANNGEIFVNVQNGFELNEIHDVDLKTTVPVNGDVLGFNGTLWVNKTIAQWLGYTPANANGTVNYVSKFTGATTLGDSQIFDNGTNVGIGTSNPNTYPYGEKLSVNGNISIGGTKIGFGTTDSFVAYGWYSAAHYGISWAGNNPLALSGYYGLGFFTNGSEKMRVTPGGEVGIGTTTPFQSKVHILKSESGSNPIPVLRIGNQGAGYTSRIVLTDETTNDANISYIGSLQSLGFGVGASLSQMIITSSGNVGIGTTSPGNLLNTFIANGAGDFGKGVRISTGNGTYTSGHGGMLEFQNEDVMTAGIRGVRQSGWGSSLLFYVHNTSAGNTFDSTFVERMRIDESGNVGIGTNSPVTKLDVNGRALVNEFQYTKAINISGANLNDYTFAGFYNGEGMVNAPNSGWFWVTVERYSGDDGWAHQTATSFGANNVANEVYTRTKTSGTWTNWKRFIDWGDINGTTNYVSKFTGNNSLGSSSIFDNGNAVGINTTNPGFITTGRGVLSLNGASTSLMEFQTGFGFKSYLYQSGTSFEIYETNTLTIAVGGSERMRVANNGNVGIGTTSPGGLLEISGGTYSTGLIVRSGSAIGAGINILNTDTGGHSWYLISTGTANGGGPGNLGFYDDTNGQYLMYINGTNGNVGIGTTGPSQKLHVVGNARITGAILDSSNSPGSSGQVLSSTGSGTAWTTGGSGGSQDLQQVTDIGNSTTNIIYFNGNIPIYGINNSVFLGSENLPNGTSYGSADKETSVGVYDDSTGAFETGVYVKRNIYCETGATTTLLEIVSPNSTVDCVIKIGNGNKFFIAKLSLIIDWSTQKYTYKIIYTNTTNFDDAAFVNDLFFIFEFPPIIGSTSFAIQLKNNTGTDIYANINANIL